MRRRLQQITRTLSDGSVLTVAVDTAGIDDVRSQLRTVLIPLLVGALVLAGLLLTIATRTALRPLDRMTRLAQGITRGQRGRRLAPERTDTELGRTAAAFDEMLDALEGAEARALASESRTRQFVADAAHELRTPIAGVQAASEAMLTAGPSADAVDRERLQVLVLGEARRASRLVEDLLSLARIDSGLEMRLEPVDLAALVTAQAEHLRLLAPDLTVEVLAPPCTILADQQQLTQVFANLLENARRYVPRPGRVLLSINGDATGVDVLVADDGPGIPTGGSGADLRPDGPAGRRPHPGGRIGRPVVGLRPWPRHRARHRPIAWRRADLRSTARPVDRRGLPASTAPVDADRTERSNRDHS